MKPYYQDDFVAIYSGDCREVIPALDVQATAIVTDPPYGLGFMGKDWDHAVPGIHFWTIIRAACLPGAPLMSFGGTRTFHRLACAIEDAGFTLRDCLGWIYGSGFPKSLDVSKAIDKARTEDAEPVRAICRAIRKAMDAAGLKSSDLTKHFGDCDPRLIDHWAARETDSQPFLPKWSQWTKLREILQIAPDLDPEVRRLNDRKSKHGDAWNGAEVVGKYGPNLPGFGSAEFKQRFTARDDLIRTPTPAAAIWTGWGTALKPAWEPIIFAMNPLDGTFAENAMEHGVAGIHVDGGRIGAGKEIPGGGGYKGGAGSRGEAWERPSRKNASAIESHTSGRFPANLIHDGSDEVLGVFPETSSHTTRDFRKKGPPGYERGWGPYGFPARSDAGSAARFFYCAKASRSEREAGCGEIDPKNRGQEYGLDAGGNTPQQSPHKHATQRNNHPTVKPLALIKYLLTLVTMPERNLILDPFVGSGTTLVAAKSKGLQAIGIDLEEGHCEIAAARCQAFVGPDIEQRTLAL